MAFNLSAQLSVALNTASLKNAAATINSQLKDVGTLKIGLPSGVASSLKDITVQAQEASNAMEQFGRQSGLAAKRFVAFTITAGAIIQFTSSIKQALSSAIEFDREMVRLAQVSTDSAGDVGKIGSEVGRLSKAYGVSSKELINTAVTLKQANLTLKETKDALEALAQAALAPSFDNLKDTTEGAIAIMNQFNISSKDLGTALGSVNSVAAEFAVEAQDLIEGVRKAGGAFRSAGGDLNQFLALFTSIRQTTRESAESIGTGLRTIFTRIQRNDTVEALKEIGVQLRYTADEAKAAGDLGLTNQFVGPYEAVKRLSAALSELRSTDPRFSAIVEELGGYRQISKVIPLVQEFAVSQKALGVAQAGSASLAANAAQAQEAFGVKIQKVAEQFNSFVRDLTNTASFRAIVDLMLQGASAAIQLADSLKGILPIITAIAAVKFTQGITSFAKGFANTAFSPVQGNQPSTLSMSPFLPIKSKKAEGGFIKMAKGGFVPGSGTGDKIPALLEPGEYVIPRKKLAGGTDKTDFSHLGRGFFPEVFGESGTIIQLADIKGFFKNKKIIKAYDQAGIDLPFDWNRKLLRNPKIGVPKEEFFKYTTDLNNPIFKTMQGLTGRQRNTERGITKQTQNLYNNEDFMTILRGQFNQRLQKISGSKAFEKIENINDDVLAKYIYPAYKKSLQSASSQFLKTIDEDNDLYETAKNITKTVFSASHVNLQMGKKRRFYPIITNNKKGVSQDRKNYLGLQFRESNKSTTYASGGLVPGVGNTDSVPLDLPIGSFVIRKSSVNSIGASNLSRLGRAKGGVIPSLVMPGEYIYTPDEVKNIGVSNLDYMNKTGRRRFAGGGYSDEERKAYRTKKTERDFARQIELQLRIPTSDAGREQNRIEAQSIAEDITKTSKRIKELENNVKKYSNEIGSGLRNEQNLNSVKTRILSDIEQRKRIVEETKTKEADELRIQNNYLEKAKRKAAVISGLEGKKLAAQNVGDYDKASKISKQIESAEKIWLGHLKDAANKQADVQAAIDTRILAEQNLVKSNNELDRTNKKLKSNRDKLDLLEKAKGGAEKERADLITKYSSDKEGRILKDGKVITSQYMSGNKTEYQKMLNREMASYRKTFGEKPVGDVRKAIETGFAEKLQRSYFNQLQSYAKAKGIGFDESLASAQATQMVREAEAGRRKVEKTKTGEFFDPTLGAKLSKEGYDKTGSKRGYTRLAKDFFSKENYQNIVFSGAALAGVTSEAIAASNEKNIRAAASGNEIASSKAQYSGAFSGLFTGAATGASIGSFLGPTGAIVGGIIGGLSGLVSGINDVKKQISDIKLSEAAEKLKTEFEVAATSFGKVSAASFGNIKRLQNEIDKEIQANAEAGVGIFSTIKSYVGFGSDYNAELNAGILQQTKSQYAGQAPQINALISKQLEEEIKSNKNFNIGQFFADEDISNQMSRLAMGLQQPLDTIKKQFAKFANDVSKQQDLANRIQQGVKAQEQLIISFSALSSAAIDAANSLNDVSPKFKTASDLLSGNTSISQIRRRSTDVESISSNPQAFLSSLREVSGGLGNFGSGFETSGQIIASISSSLPAILSQVNPLETSPGRDPANVVKSALRENLKQQGFREEDISRYINTVIGKMGDDFSKLLNESGGDYGELAKRLTSAISEPLLRSFKDISMSLETAADKYVEGLNRLTQANLNTVQEYDRLSKIQAQNRAFLKSNAIESEITKAKTANPMAFRFNEIRTEQIALDMTNVDEQIQAFREQQTRLTGLQNGQELSPAAIQARIRSNRERTEIAQQKYDESRLTAGPNNRGIYEAAARELQALKQETSMLNAAMRNLADSTDELSAIENRIGAIRRELADEEQRNIRKQQQVEQTGERLLTSSPEQLQRYQAGAQLTGIAEASGGNLLKFNVEQRKAIFEYLDILGEEGQKRKSQLLQASGFVAKPETTAQEKYATELQVLIKRMIEVGMRREAAQSLIIDEQKTLQQSFFAELTRQNEKFFSRLEANLIKKEAEQKSEQQRNIEGRIGALQAIEPSVRMFGGMDTATYNAQIRPRQRDIANYLSIDEKQKSLQAESNKYLGLGSSNIIEKAKAIGGGAINFQSLLVGLQSVGSIDRKKLEQISLSFVNDKSLRGKSDQDLSLALGKLITDQFAVEIARTQSDLTTAGSKVGIKEGKADTDLGRFVQSLQAANVTSQAFSKAVDDIARLGNIVGVQYFNEIEKLKNQSIQAAQGVAVLNQQLGQRNVPLQNQPVVAPRPFAFGGMVTASSGLKNADPRVFRPKGPDTIPAILSPGEFVINAKATAENLPLLQTLNNGGQVNYLEDGGMPQLAAPVPMNFLEAQRVREYQKDMAVKQAIITRFGFLRGSWRTNALSNSYRIQRGDANLRNVPFLNGSTDIQTVVSPFVKEPWTKINDISAIGLKAPFTPEQIVEFHKNKQNIFGMPLSMKLLDIGTLLSATEDYLYGGQEAGPNNPFREINKNKQFYANASKIKEFFEAWLMIGSPIVNADGVKEFYNVKKKMDVIGFSSGGQSNGFTPAMLNRGEFVVNAKSANKNLPLLQKLNKGGKVQYLREGGKTPKPWWSNLNPFNWSNKEESNTTQIIGTEGNNESYAPYVWSGIALGAGTAIGAGMLWKNSRNKIEMLKREKYSQYEDSEFDRLISKNEKIDPEYFKTGTRNEQRLKQYFVDRLNGQGFKLKTDDIIIDDGNITAYYKADKKIKVGLGGSSGKDFNSLSQNILHEAVHFLDYRGMQKPISKITESELFLDILEKDKKSIEESKKFQIFDDERIVRKLVGKDKDFLKKLGVDDSKFNDFKDEAKLLKSVKKLSKEDKLKLTKEYYSRPQEVLARIGETLGDTSTYGSTRPGSEITQQSIRASYEQNRFKNESIQQFTERLLFDVLGDRLRARDQFGQLIDANDMAKAVANEEAARQAKAQPQEGQGRAKRNQPVPVKPEVKPQPNPNEINAAKDRIAFRKGELTGPPPPSSVEQAKNQQLEALTKPVVESKNISTPSETPENIKLTNAVYDDIIKLSKSKELSESVTKNVLKQTKDFYDINKRYPTPPEIDEFINQAKINEFNSSSFDNLGYDLEKIRSTDLEAQKDLIPQKPQPSVSPEENIKINTALENVKKTKERALFIQDKLSTLKGIFSSEKGMSIFNGLRSGAGLALGFSPQFIVDTALSSSKGKTSVDVAKDISLSAIEGLPWITAFGVTASKFPQITGPLGALFIPLEVDRVNSLFNELSGKEKDPERSILKYEKYIPGISQFKPKNTIFGGDEDSTVAGDLTGLAAGVGGALIGTPVVGEAAILAAIAAIGIIASYKAVANMIAREQKRRRISSAVNTRTDLSARFAKRGFELADIGFMQEPDKEYYNNLLQKDPFTYFKMFGAAFEAAAISQDENYGPDKQRFMNKFPFTSADDSLVADQLDGDRKQNFIDEVSNLQKNNASIFEIESLRRRYLEGMDTYAQEYGKTEFSANKKNADGSDYIATKVTDENTKNDIFTKLLLRNQNVNPGEQVWNILNRSSIGKKVYEKENAEFLLNILDKAKEAQFIYENSEFDLNYLFKDFFESKNENNNQAPIDSLLENKYRQEIIKQKMPKLLLEIKARELQKKYYEANLGSISTKDEITNEYDKINKQILSLETEISNTANLPENEIGQSNRFTELSGLKDRKKFIESLYKQLLEKTYIEKLLQGDEQLNYRGLLEQQILNNESLLKKSKTDAVLDVLIGDAVKVLYKYKKFNSPSDNIKYSNINNSRLGNKEDITEEEFFEMPFDFENKTHRNPLKFFSDYKKIDYTYKFASGGMVPQTAPNPNPSLFVPKGTDTVPAMLSPGEYVVNAKATAANLPLLQNLNRGGVVYKADGGLLSSLGSLNPEDEKRLAEITKQIRREDLITNLGKQTNQEIKLREERLRLPFGAYVRNPKATYDNLPLSSPNTLNNNLLNFFDNSNRNFAYSRGFLVNYLNKSQQNPFFNDVKYVKSGGIIYAANGYSISSINMDYAKLTGLPPGLTAINTAPVFLGMEKGNNGFSSQRVFGRRPTYYYDAGPEGALYRRNEKYYENARLNTLENLANYMADRFGTLRRDKSKWYTWNVAWGKALEAFGIGGQGGQFSLSQTDRPIPDLGAMMNMSSFFAGPKMAYAQKYAIENWTWEDILNNDEVAMGPIGNYKMSDVGTRYIEGLIGGPPVQNGRGKISLNKYRNILAFSKAGNSVYQGVSANAALAKGSLADLPGANLSASMAAISDVQNYGLGKLSVNNTDMAAAKYYTGLQNAIRSAYSQPIQRTTPPLRYYNNNWNWAGALENQRRNASFFNRYQARGFKSGGPSGTDSIPAMLTPGEYVVNKQAVDRVGTGFLDKINNARGYANGGFVKYFADGSQNGVSSSRIGTATAVLDLSSLSSATSNLSNASSFFSDASQSISSAISSTGSLLSGLVSNLGTSNGLIEKASSAINSASNGFLSSSIAFAQNITTLATAINSIPRTITLNVAPVTMNVAFNTAAVLQAIQASISQIESTTLSQINGIISRQIDERLG